MSLQTNSSTVQVQPSSTPSSSAKTAERFTVFTDTSPTDTKEAAKVTVPISRKEAAKVTVEVPTSSSLPVNPFDPTWIKLWEQVGPISYLALLCVFIWLLTRFVETVKSK
ncbi:MAG: hypothetical protein IGS48_11570 [Oscillatoriales cyanobacterium C42_A2020_001]|nr:hypothetical protein [Leptolyngbyaceae cyanobacterium C42_A2020_001]